MTPPSPRDPRYGRFFDLFNRGRFFEAHEALEPLWLATRGDLAGFYKGLIQVAGAFVHLAKSRPSPARRLLLLARANLAPHAPEREGLDVAALLARLAAWEARLAAGAPTAEPLAGARAAPIAPRLSGRRGAGAASAAARSRSGRG